MDSECLGRMDSEWIQSGLKTDVEVTHLDKEKLFLNKEKTILDKEQSILDKEQSVKNNLEDFLAYMESSTTAFRAVAETAKRLEAEGYERIVEKETWKITWGDKKYVIRNDSSLIAFQIPERPRSDERGISGFHMICAHGDSPGFKLKENPVITVGDSYVKLNVEKYGGMIMESWLDRPLSLAGRIVVKGKETTRQKPVLESRLVDLKEPVFVIPSLAIHMQKGTTQEKELNPQLHLLPLAGTDVTEGIFMERLAKQAEVNPEDILGTDLYLYPVQKPMVMGMEGELVGAPRLDDLACAYCGLNALISAQPQDRIAVLALFDNEEVGSTTMQGAASNFLLQTLTRISDSLGQNREQLLAESFLISADNAHAFHPNYEGKADPTNRPVLNGGIVIKYHGGQKYTTSAYSGAFVKAICQQEKIPYQTYHNRSDIAGGSTLGNIALTSVSVPAADIGLPQLAMHSAFETAGVKDLRYMQDFMQIFYNIG